MKPFAIALLLATLCGCAARHAEQYAKELRGVLSTYQQEVARKVKAEQESYQNLAAIYEGGERTQRIRVLEQERLERASALTDDLMERPRALPMSDLRRLLREYAGLDFATSQDVLAREMDAAARRLINLEALNAAIQQADALDGVLADLSTPKKTLTRLKEGALFVEKAKACLDEKVCATLKTELDGLKAKQKTAKTDGEKQTLAQQIKIVENAQKSHGCAANPKCGG